MRVGGLGALKLGLDALLRARTAQAGRAHWPQCNAALFAGAGIKMGQVLEASDREVAYPEGTGYTPEEVVATSSSLLGIDTAKEYHHHLGRPWPIETGEQIRALLA